MGSEEELLAFWRRLIRAPQKYVAITIDFSALFSMHGNIRLLRVQQSLVRDMAERLRGNVFMMANGDMAMIARLDTIGAASAIESELVQWILKDPDIAEDTLRKLLRSFEMPDQFRELRGWIGRYLKGGELANAATGAAATDPDEPDADLRGPMTAAMLTRIEHRIVRREIRQFLKKQDVFVRHATGIWWPMMEERFISLADMKRKLFPDVELRPSDPLFSQLCRILDERLLHHLMASKTKIAHKVSINLSVDTVHDRLMDIFAGHLDEKERASLHFEIACGDIFQDVTKATSAIAKLRRLGFGVIVDGLTLELLPYVRVNKFDADLIKIHLGRHDVRMLGDDACIKAIRRLPLDKLVFSRCDHDGAIKVGETLNIRMYQGWLIDEQAMTAQAAPMAQEAATRYN